MDRTIINNKTDISDIEALDFVIAVMKQGKISNNGKQYCYVTTFGYDGNDDIVVISNLIKDGHSFTVRYK